MPDVFIDSETIPDKTGATSTIRPESKNRSHHAASQNKRHRLKSLATFCEYPDGVTFQHQVNNEEILLFLRQHIATNIPWIIITALLILTPFILVPFFSLTNIFPIIVSPLQILLLILLYYLMVFGYAFVNFLHWFYNIGIVTNERVIDLDYDSIVRVHVSTTKVLQVQDVSYTQGGFFRTLFNFGNVYVQTAGQDPNFEFLRIPMPSRATFIIQKLIGKA